MTPADYLAAILLGIFAIGFFINVRNATLLTWLKAKFLGLPRPASADVAGAKTGSSS